MYLRLAIAAAALGGAALGGWYVEHWRLGAKIAEIEAEASEQKAEYKAKETEWGKAMLKLMEDGYAEAENLRAAAARADAASRSLHDTSRSTAAAAATAPGTSEAAAAAIMVRERLFREADEAAGILAKAVREFRAAGLACERGYEVTR